ncbi:MAG: 2Fe-2S iron-sulfur cluster-binding protein [Acidobacteriota bacterium]
MLNIHFPTHALAGRCKAGLTLHEAIRRMGHVLDFACGGNALCGTCCVRVVEGLEHLTPIGKSEAEQLLVLDLGQPHRLACQARLRGEGGRLTVVNC